ncbi:MAG: nucleotidyltransferase domain-containing protein [Nitrospiraceae bacterium]
MAEMVTAVMAVHEKVNEMVRRIVQRFASDKIILFGSYASDTADPDSDVIGSALREGKILYDRAA